MTLIEVLLTYRELVRRENRAVANQFVDNACHSIVATDVKASVNNNGEFIDADGYEFDVFSDRLV